VSVVPLAAPAVRVTVANVPSFIKEVLMKELVKLGKVVSRLKMIPLGWKSPRMRHVMSHRRHLFMILNNRSGELCSGCTSRWRGMTTPCIFHQGMGNVLFVGGRET